MDFADSPEHAAFRGKVRGWLEANVPSEICVDDAADQRVAPDRETFEKRIHWQRTMHAAGWVGLPCEIQRNIIGERVLGSPRG
jgi:hypothetical protein